MKYSSVLECIQAAEKIGHDHEIINVPKGHEHDTNPSWIVSSSQKFQHDHVIPDHVWRLVDSDCTLLVAQKWGVYRETVALYVWKKGLQPVQRSIDFVGQFNATCKSRYAVKCLKALPDKH